MSEGSVDDQRLAYLCLQPMAEGQASYVHVREIVAGLQDLGWRTSVHATTSDASTGLIGRLLDAIRLQCRGLSPALGSVDVLYVRWHPASLLGVLRARYRRVPVVLEVNGPPEDFTAAWPALRPLRWLIARSLRSQLGWSAASVTVSTGLASWLRQMSPKTPVQVIPNAADPDHFHPEAAGDVAPGEPYALFFGALAPWQGLELLLEATLEPAWPSQLQLWVVGDGPLRELVEAASLRRPDRVRYLGRRPYAQMPRVVAESSVVAIPKVYHRPELGLSPLKLYESMAAGAPVVVTDLPGLADVVVSEGCGLVVSSNHPEDLATAIATAAERPDLGSRGRAALVARHTWGERARSTDVLLRRVVRGETPT